MEFYLCTTDNIPVSILALYLLKRSFVVSRQTIMWHSRKTTWGLLIISQLWEPETTAQAKQPPTQISHQGHSPRPLTQVVLNL